MARVLAEVTVDLNDFETDELRDEIESRGLTVIDPDDSDGPDFYKDRIRTLKSDFINWKDFGMSNERFEDVLKQFFKDTVDDYIV